MSSARGEQPEQIFLVIFRKAPDPALVKRVKERLTKMSEDRCELLFSTSDGFVLGLVLRAALAAAQLRAAVESILNPGDRDFILVLSLDKDWSATGNSAGWRHLQQLMSIA